MWRKYVYRSVKCIYNTDKIDLKIWTDKGLYIMYRRKFYSFTTNRLLCKTAVTCEIKLF